MNKQLTVIEVRIRAVKKMQVNCCHRVFRGLGCIYLGDQKIPLCNYNLSIYSYVFVYALKQDSLVAHSFSNFHPQMTLILPSGSGVIDL